MTDTLNPKLFRDVGTVPAGSRALSVAVERGHNPRRHLFVIAGPGGETVTRLTTTEVDELITLLSIARDEGRVLDAREPTRARETPAPAVQRGPSGGKRAAP